MNKNILNSKMTLYGDRSSDLADALGISKSRLSAKINETKGAEFRQGEIRIIKDRYNLTPQEVDEIFFNNQVS